MDKLLPFLCICAATLSYAGVCTWLERRRLRLAARRSDVEWETAKREITRKAFSGEITLADARDMLDQIENRGC